MRSSVSPISQWGRGWNTNSAGVPHSERTTLSSSPPGGTWSVTAAASPAAAPAAGGHGGGDHGGGHGGFADIEWVTPVFGHSGKLGLLWILINFAVLMWLLALVTVVAIYRDQRRHGNRRPFFVALAGLLVLVGTLYIHWNVMVLFLGYVLLLSAAFTNQNAILKMLNSRVQTQAAELAERDLAVVVDVDHAEKLLRGELEKPARGLTAPLGIDHLGVPVVDRALERRGVVRDVDHGAGCVLLHKKPTSARHALLRAARAVDAGKNAPAPPSVVNE